MSQSNATSFENLQAAVLRVFKRTDKTTEIKEAINDTLREMTAAIDPRKRKDQIYKACVAGREEVTIPDTILRINHPVRLIDPTASSGSGASYPMTFYPKDEYDVLEPNPNASSVETGKPYAYTFFKNSILLTHIPDRVYHLEMNVGGEHVELVEDEDKSIFAPTWDEIIKAGTLARAFAGIRFWSEVEQWRGVYRYGFAGNDGNIVGGLELLKRLNDQIEKAPMIIKPNDF